MLKRISLILLMLSHTLIAASLESQADYAPGILIVKTKPKYGLSAQSAKNSLAKFSEQYKPKNITPLSSPKINTISSQSLNQSTWVIEFDENTNIETLALTYKKESWIEYAEPNYYVYSFSLPNDPKFSEQTYLSNTTIKEMLDIEINTNITIAVIDSGVDYNHPDIQSNIYINPNEIDDGIDNDNNGYIDDISGYNFYHHYQGAGHNDPMDNYGHGTHIAGIIGAKTNNNLGISGLNTQAKIIPINFLDSFGRGTQLDGATSIFYAVDMGAKIINCSWGYHRYNTLLEEAVNYAAENGVIIVAAAGNTSMDIVEYPAGFESVFSIASTDSQQNRSYFSSYGNHMDFSMYGQGIISLLPNSSYGSKSGTSQSAAITTGIISRILAYNPSFTPQNIYDLLVDSCIDIHTEGKDKYTGYGILDISTLITALAQHPYESENTNPPNPLTSINTDPILENVLNFPNPVRNNQTKFGFTTNQAGLITIRIFDLKGRILKTLEESIGAGDSYNTVTWDTLNNYGEFLRNGTYFYTVQFKNATRTITKRGKLSILK